MEDSGSVLSKDNFREQAAKSQVQKGRAARSMIDSGTTAAYGFSGTCRMQIVWLTV